MLWLVAFYLIVAASADTGSEVLKILEFTISPSGPVPEKTEIFATVRIYSPFEKPTHEYWIIRDSIVKEIFRDNKLNLTTLSDTQYESKVSLGRFFRSMDVVLQVSNSKGKVSKEIAVDVDNDKLGRPCETSEDCLAANSNSECHPVKNICFCAPGYGIDYDEDDKNCRKYPFHKIRVQRFEQAIDLDCKIFTSNFTDIFWYRDGELCTYGSSCSQDEDLYYGEEEEEEEEKLYSFQRRRLWFQRKLLLMKVREDHTYTCKTIDSNGKMFTVVEEKVGIIDTFKTTNYDVAGYNASIYCNLQIQNYQARFVRDGKDVCTPDTTWCKIGKPKLSLRWFRIVNVRENHTFTCEAYQDNFNISTMAVHRVFIGEKPKILEVTISPPGTKPIPKGTEVSLTARIYNPTGAPDRRWKLSYYGFEKSIQDNLTILSNVSLSTVSLGPIQRNNLITLEVSNVYGQDEKDIRIDVDDD